MKKLFLGLLLLLFMPLANALSAQASFVMDADTGAALHQQNADTELPMASTTKIMTALVVLEAGDLDRVYTVKPSYAAVEGSSMYLQEGERISIRDTLYGLLLCSGNDAAVALAGECGGQQAFIQKMNDRAASLGLQHTHFDNPNGLDGESHYTTARELAVITAEAMQNELFRQIVSTQTYTAGNRVMSNHNRLLSSLEGAIGVKTGYTRTAGRCLVSAATRNGRTVIAVTLHDPDDWADHAELIENAFVQYESVPLHTAGEIIDTRTVVGGTPAVVTRKAQHDLSAFLTEAEQKKIEKITFGAHICYAPIIDTSVGGAVCYRIGDFTVAEDTLLYGNASLMLPEEQSILDKLLIRLAGAA